MRYETVHKLLITIEHWSKLTSCIDDVGIVDSQYHQTKGSTRYETVHKFKSWLPLNTEVNLPAVLMMWELWIHNIIKQKEARDMKQFTSYWLPLNTEVNLPPVLMMWELWIHNIIKEKEARDIQPVHKLLITIEHWSKLTRCIDDVWIVDSQYHQTKGSTRYETVHKVLITIEHWRTLKKTYRLYWWCEHCGFTVSSKKRKNEIWNRTKVTNYH